MRLDIFEFLTHERIIFFAIPSCGLYTGYTDFRHRKTSNIYVLFLVGFGIMSQPLIESRIYVGSMRSLAFKLFRVLSFATCLGEQCVT